MGAFENRRFTYTDFCALPEGERWELIDGQLFSLAPSPSPAHQDVSEALEDILRAYFKDGSCRAHHAPRDVALFVQPGMRPEDIPVVVQPDVFVMCQAYQMGNCIAGELKWVIEILSPASVRHDKVRKFNLYQRAGVPLYWLVDPLYRTVESFTLRDGAYGAPAVYSVPDVIMVEMFPGLTVDLNHIFPAEA
ncbi:hypothetical protein GCM10010885_06650 [Alicyclobacillus cellulosilyticus]|uniref:Putative restriction endonuclease domain-containing protein n=1 Tax=Alicyclobacillus cellulosilyticus TaxID=1003997 RepID=A0A917K5Q9_9BACL|nr:Uma2 family endonuclease [Alicyclobacillus cellulosilyticus]GGJ00050.1 hypothetical protein GCM10010885_06650 [Alicyclobacillus cellulosilyticus]